MRYIHYYAVMTLIGLWFVVTTVVCLFFVPFFWRKPFLNHAYGRMLAKPGQLFMGLRVKVQGGEHLYSAQPCVYVSNHQSNLDLVTYGSLYPYNTLAIGKIELAAIPLFGWYFAAGGNVLINRKNAKHSISGLEKAKEAMLKRGASIWIFPEGTRNRGSKELLPFKRGAFHLAISAQRPIVPIVNHHLHAYLRNDEKRIIPGVIRQVVLPPIETKGLTAQDIDALMVRVRTAMTEVLNETVPH